MEIAVRAFVLDEDNNILLVKHENGQKRTLPGGHVENEETVYDALTRELTEELNAETTIIGPDSVFSQYDIVSFPLPISIHKVSYEHRNRGHVEKLEYVFFARVNEAIEYIDNEEIFEWKRFSQDDLAALDDAHDIHRWIQQLMEQNEDLLELL